MAHPTKYRKGKYRYKYVGRTSKLTEECVKKLEEATAIGASVKRACYYAGISRETYYQWLKQNPDLSDRLDDIRERLPLKALQNIAAHIESNNPITGDISLSKWLLERTESDKYGE